MNSFYTSICLYLLVNSWGTNAYSVAPTKSYFQTQKHYNARPRLSNLRTYQTANLASDPYYSDQSGPFNQGASEYLEEYPDEYPYPRSYPTSGQRDWRTIINDPHDESAWTSRNTNNLYASQQLSPFKSSTILEPFLRPKASPKQSSLRTSSIFGSPVNPADQLTQYRGSTSSSAFPIPAIQERSLNPWFSGKGASFNEGFPNQRPHTWNNVYGLKSPAPQQRLSGPSSGVELRRQRNTYDSSYPTRSLSSGYQGNDPFGSNSISFWDDGESSQYFGEPWGSNGDALDHNGFNGQSYYGGASYGDVDEGYGTQPERYLDDGSSSDYPPSTWSSQPPPPTGYGTSGKPYEPVAVQTIPAQYGRSDLTGNAEDELGAANNYPSPLYPRYNTTNNYPGQRSSPFHISTSLVSQEDDATFPRSPRALPPTSNYVWNQKPNYSNGPNQAYPTNRYYPETYPTLTQDRPWFEENENEQWQGEFSEPYQTDYALGY